jgi:magnesium and cobalt exporter, CNNM family
MVWMNVGVVLGLALVSMCLAAVEASFYLLKRRRFSHLAVPNPRAELANRYLDDPPTLLMPVHMGTYTAHVAMTVITTSLLLDLLPHWATLVAFLAMILYLFFFRLTLPYALVRRSPERSLLLLLPVFHLYAQALAPLVSFLRKRSGGEEEPGAGPLTAEVPPPPVQENDAERLATALERFSETQVREVMTPRPDVVAIHADATVADLRLLFRETMYSRVPVYAENLDDVVGVVTVRDLVEYEGDPGGSVSSLMRPAFLVPETKRIAVLLKELQARGTTLAVAIDEYGGTAGLVSVEDIVEELVGEIKDEYDVETEPIAFDEDGALQVSGRVSLDRLQEALETSIGEDTEVDTVGGLVTSVFGRVPRPGERVDYQGFSIEVLDAERKRVNRVRLRRLPEEADA